MSVSPSEFLESAQIMANGSGEIEKRNAISRCYYAAFHISSSKLKMEKSDLQSSVCMHKTYIDFLTQHSESSIHRTIGLNLKKLHARRVIADYRLADTVNKSDAALQISATKKVFELLES